MWHPRTPGKGQMVLFFACKLLILTIMVLPRARADTTAGDACQAIITAGVYNTFSTINTVSTFAQTQNALCQDYDSYTYDQYQLDTINSAGAASSSSRSDSFSIAGGGLGFSADVKGSFGGANGNSRYSENQFSQAKEAIRSYRSASCGSSSIVNSGDAVVKNLQTIIEPAVYSAYTACLDSYNQGLQSTVTLDSDLTSGQISLLYKPKAAGSVATLSGVTFSRAGVVECTFIGEGTPNSTVNDTLQLAVVLKDNQRFSVSCRVRKGAPLDGRYTTISVFSDAQVNVLRMSLLSGVPPTDLQNLQRQVADLQGKLSNATSQLSAVTEKVGDLEPIRNLTSTGTTSYCVIRSGGLCPDGWAEGNVRFTGLSGQIKVCNGTTGDLFVYDEAPGRLPIPMCGGPNNEGNIFSISVCCFGDAPRGLEY